MISRHDFKTIVEAVRKHDQRVNKLSEALDVIVDSLYEFPQVIMDYVEQQTGVVWTDEIWDQVYNHELKVDVDNIYNDIEKLITEESK